jgi:DNA-binding NarL/FixJ family response regulator
MAIRVLLVDDHDLVCAGYRALMKDMPGIEVVAEARNGREALDRVADHHPDLVLMDIMMPELNGLDATAQIVSRFPRVRVVIVSMNDTEEYVLQSLRAGAAGYLLKNISPLELDKTIRAVAGGEVHFTTAVAKHVLAGYLQRNTGKTSTFEKLTSRQREVLQLVAESNSTKEIAKILGIGVKTAETHRSELMQVLDLHDVAGLVRYAIRMGVITADH